MHFEPPDLEDSDLDVAPAIISLDYETYCDIYRAFDDRAVVVEFHVMMGAHATLVDIPLYEWTWPNPSFSSTITVFQPDAPLFYARLEEEGLELPKPTDFVEAEVDEVIVVSEVMDVPCPACGMSELVVENTLEQSLILDVIAKSFHIELTMTPCVEHGAHFSFGKHVAKGLRCNACLTTYAYSSAFKNKFVMLMVIQ